MCIKYLISVSVICLIVASCSNEQSLINHNSPFNAYIFAKQKLQNGDYKDAINRLETIESRYPFSPYTQKVQFNLIYAYYKTGNLPLAQSSIDRFLWFNPTSPQIDYVLYMRGLINMSLEDNILQEFLGIYIDHNTKSNRIAFLDFKELIKNYPDSKYAMDAIKRLIYLKDILSKHELSIVKYYNEREAYIAVVNRVEQMLRDFPDTQATREALGYMEKAYKKLQLNDQAKKVTKIMEANPI